MAEFRSTRDRAQRPVESDTQPSLIWFFMATFIVTWAFWIPNAFVFGDQVSVDDPLSTPGFVILQTLGAAVPSIVAYWLLRWRGGKEAVRPVLERYKIWRVGLQWYLVAVLLMPAIQIGSLFIAGVFSEGPVVDPSSPLGQTLAQMGVVGALTVFPLTVLAQMFSSPLLEEFGWRGLALPRL